MRASFDHASASPPCGSVLEIIQVPHRLTIMPFLDTYKPSTKLSPKLLNMPPYKLSPEK